MGSSKLTATPQYAWVVAGSTFLLGICGIASTMAWGFTSPYIAAQFGVDVVDIAIGMSLFGLFCSGFGFVVGIVGDHLGIRLVCTGGCLGLGACMLLLGFVAASLPVVIGLYALSGIFASAVGATLMPKLFANWFAPSVRGRGMAINTVGGALSGVVLGIVAPWLILSFGWQGTFRTLGVVFLACGLLFFLLARDCPLDVGTVPFGYDPAEGINPSATPDRDGAQYGKEVYPARQSPIARVLRTPATWFFSAAFILWQVYFTCVNAYQAASIMEAGFSITVAGFVGAITTGCLIVSQIVGSSLSDRVSRKAILGVECIALGLAFLVVHWLLGAKLDTPIPLYVCYAILGFVSGMAPLFQNLMGEIYPQDIRGTGAGVITTISIVGTFGGPLMGSAFIQFSGGYVASVYYLIAACLFISGLIIIAFLPNTGGKYGDPLASLE